MDSLECADEMDQCGADVRGDIDGILDEHGIEGAERQEAFNECGTYKALYEWLGY